MNCIVCKREFQGAECPDCGAHADGKVTSEIRACGSVVVKYTRPDGSKWNIKGYIPDKVFLKKVV